MGPAPAQLATMQLTELPGSLPMPSMFLGYPAGSCMQRGCINLSLMATPWDEILQQPLHWLWVFVAGPQGAEAPPERNRLRDVGSEPSVPKPYKFLEQNLSRKFQFYLQIFLKSSKLDIVLSDRQDPQQQTRWLHLQSLQPFESVWTTIDITSTGWGSGYQRIGRSSLHG